MKKALSLLAAIVAATPAHSAFVVPEKEPAPPKDYTISGLEWGGCVTNQEYELTHLSNIDAECYRIFRAQPSFHHINWKNARKCEDYTPGCVDLEGIIVVDSMRYEIFEVKTHWSINRGNYTRLNVKPISTDIQYQDYKINCLNTYSIIGTRDSMGEISHLYTNKKFQKDVCDSVFPEPEKDTAYRMKELACNLARDPEQKKRLCDGFVEWNNQRRWQ